MDQIIDKIAGNILGGEDVALLTPEERRTLIRGSCLRSAFFISPGVLQDQLIEKPSGEPKPSPEFRANPVVMSHFAMRRPFASNQTYIFIREILREEKPYYDTLRYRLFAAGRPMRTYVQTEEGIRKQPIESDADFRLYYNKCMRLADSIRQHGMLDMSRKEDFLSLPEHGRKKDANVGVAIDHAGELLAFWTGQHRLALAQVLELNEIPVTVHVISGEYLSNFVDKAELRRPGAILKAIEAATARAGLKASKPIDEPQETIRRPGEANGTIKASGRA